MLKSELQLNWPVWLLTECTLTYTVFKRKSKIYANVCCPTHQFVKHIVCLFLKSNHYFLIPVCNGYPGQKASAMLIVCLAVTCSVINVQTRTPPRPTPLPGYWHSRSLCVENNVLVWLNSVIPKIWNRKKSEFCKYRKYNSIKRKLGSEWHRCLSMNYEEWMLLSGSWHSLDCACSSRVWEVSLLSKYKVTWPQTLG